MKPDDDRVPRHLAVIMDGSGRWAQQNGMPRLAGHRRGLDAARALVESCARRGIAFLTLFAFSRENWQRPVDEVSGLMRLFAGMGQWQGKLVDAGVRLVFVGERGRFSAQLQDLMAAMEEATRGGDKITVAIAADYSGQWDILQAARKVMDAGGDFDEDGFAAHLATASMPAPDLLIRSGGERRISNFMLWQLSYSELYFTDVLWPDFGERDLELALEDYARRDRRFGRVGDG